MDTKKFIQEAVHYAAWLIAFLAISELHQSSKISAKAKAEFYNELCLAETSITPEERREHLRFAYAAYRNLGVSNTLECKRKYKEIKKELGL